MFNQQSKLLLSQLVMQLTTFVGIYYYWGTFTGLDYFIIFISIFFFAVVTLETFLHRYCSHKAFELDKKIETLLLYCTTFTLQPPALVWAPNHITHHRYSDKEGDSHPASNGWRTWFWWNTYKNNMISGHTVKRLLKNKHFRIQYENYFKIYYMFMIVVFFQIFFLQIKKINIDDPHNCYNTFKSNNDLGFIITLSLILGKI